MYMYSLDNANPDEIMKNLSNFSQITYEERSNMIEKYVQDPSLLELLKYMLSDFDKRPTAIELSKTSVFVSLIRLLNARNNPNTINSPSNTHPNFSINFMPNLTDHNPGNTNNISIEPYSLNIIGQDLADKSVMLTGKLKYTKQSVDSIIYNRNVKQM